MQHIRPIQTHQTTDEHEHIGYVSLYTGNLEQAIWFYETMAGMLKLRRGAKFAILGTAKNIPLIILTEIEQAAKRAKHETGLDHFAILVPSRLELSKHFRRFVDHNYPLNMVADHGVNESFYVHDPDGNLIEFTRDLTADELHDHRPLHATELANILYALSPPLQANTVSPDTRIGHVLLRVTNLEEAELFYTQYIGLEVTMRMHGAVFVSAGSYHHHVGFHIWETQNGRAPSTAAIGLRYFTIQVPRHEAFTSIRAAFRERNIEVVGDNRKISLTDPSGNGISITSEDVDRLEEAFELEGIFAKLC